MNMLAPLHTATSTAATRPVDPALKTAANQFEAIFIRSLLSASRQAKLEDDVLGSSETDNFLEMSDARTADALAAQGQFGIGKMLENQFTGKGATHV
jgi:flagellar protein FlgJ